MMILLNRNERASENDCEWRVPKNCNGFECEQRPGARVWNYQVPSFIRR